MPWKLPEEPRRVFAILSFIAALGGGAIIVLYVVTYLIRLYR